jgi:hypothetical protein
VKPQERFALIGVGLTPKARRRPTDRADLVKPKATVAQR